MKSRIKVTVTPVNKKNKQDKKAARLLQEFMEHEYKEYEDIVKEILKARSFVEIMLGQKTPNHIWDRILQAVVKRDIQKMKGKEIYES